MDVTVFHLMPWQSVEDDIGWPFSNDRFEPAEGSELYETYLSQLAYCEELGYDAVGLNEHHFSAFGLMPSPNLMAANLAARTDDVAITIYGNVLPLRGHPIRVAEELAMVDNLSEGRLISGFVRGIPSEYAAYGVNPNESRGRFGEAWDLVVRSWTEPEPFDFEGEYYSYEDVYIWPRPYQEPHPPLRMPAESEKSIQFAVEKQVPIGRVFVGTRGLRDTYGRYRELAEEAGWSPDASYFDAARMVYVAEDMETAREEAEEPLRYFYEDLLGAVFKAGAVQMVGDSEYREENAFEYEEAAPEKGQQAMNFDFDDFQERGEIIVGDPSYVAGEIESQYEETGGFGNLIGTFQFGTLSDALTRKNLELFADEVMPQIRRL
jgi:alkanesulfonate monooxygenase SsuD/methylene tetrahydromethanopterin reductase-like flavin-dependent oxidoreductase (luciferase family)